MKFSKRMIVAVIAAVLAAILIGAYGWSIQGSRSSGRVSAVKAYGNKATEVYIAVADIAKGERISANAVQRVAWPSALLGAEVATKKNECVGKIAKTALLANEPVALSRVGDSSGGLQVPSGFTAVTIPSEDVRSVGGAIAPGTYVDLYAAIGGTVSLLKQKVLVLDTSAGEPKRSTGASSSGRPPISWVTVALENQSVQQVLSIIETGDIDLVLPGSRQEK